MILRRRKAAPTLPGLFIVRRALTNGGWPWEVLEARIDGAGNLDLGPWASRVTWKYEVTDGDRVGAEALVAENNARDHAEAGPVRAFGGRR
jgi:hypothetical protein